MQRHQRGLMERERLARDLHDTLLQGLQGLMLRLQSATERIPPQEPARRMMEDALERGDQLLLDGRDGHERLHAAYHAGARLLRLRMAGGAKPRSSHVSQLSLDLDQRRDEA